MPIRQITFAIRGTRLDDGTWELERRNGRYHSAAIFHGGTMREAMDAMTRLTHWDGFVQTAREGSMEGFADKLTIAFAKALNAPHHIPPEMADQELEDCH